MEERRSISKGYTNLHFILLNVLKIKAFRKIKNRIKIIVVLANRKARFFILGVSILIKKVSIKTFGVCIDITWLIWLKE